MCSIQQIKDAIPMFDSLPMGIIVTELDGSIVYVNKNFEDISGFSFVDVRGLTPSVLKSDEHDTIFYKNMWDTILGGNTFEIEIKNRKKNKEEYWQKIAIQPFRDMDGNVANFIAYITDITSIRYENMMFEAMIKNSYDSHVIWDRHRKCVNAYPSNSTKYPMFYTALKNRNVMEALLFMRDLFEKENNISIPIKYKGDMTEKFDELFDAVDFDEEKSFSSIAIAYDPHGEKIILEIVMQRFNTNKYYTAIRNITDFTRSRTALVDMKTALREWTTLDTKKLEYIDERK